MQGALVISNKIKIRLKTMPLLYEIFFSATHKVMKKLEWNRFRPFQFSLERVPSRGSRKTECMIHKSESPWHVNAPEFEFLDLSGPASKFSVTHNGIMFHSSSDDTQLFEAHHCRLVVSNILNVVSQSASFLKIWMKVEATWRTDF